MRLRPIASLLLSTAFVAAAASSAEYRIDPKHSRLGFAVRHMGVSTVRGDFDSYSGTFDIDEADLTRSRVEVAIETASIDTGVEDRDNHLRSGDFFDAATHPQITFVGKSIAPGAAAGEYVVTGDLTMRGVTKEVQLPLTVAGPIDLGDSLRMGVSGGTTINRKDYGVAWHRVLDTGGLVVADEVAIEIEAELVRPKEAAAPAGGR